METEPGLSAAVRVEEEGWAMVPAADKWAAIVPAPGRAAIAFARDVRKKSLIKEERLVFPEFARPVAAKWSKLKLKKEVRENNKRYRERKELYLKFGIDIDKERSFILEKSYPLFGEILEVGTGKGYFTLTLAKEGYSFTSLDVSREEQDYARLNLKFFGLEQKVNFKIGDAQNLDFPDGSLAVIFSINTIHHLKNPFKVIDELIRVLSSEGKIILSDFTPLGFEVVDKVHNREGHNHPRSATGMDDIFRYLADKGFDVKRENSEFQDILIAFRPNV